MRMVVTGASGYVGGRLVPRLLEKGHDVTVIVRDAARIDDVPWRDKVTIVRGDLEDRNVVTHALSGGDVLYYLVHSMASSAIQAPIAAISKYQLTLHDPPRLGPR